MIASAPAGRKLGRGRLALTVALGLLVGVGGSAARGEDAPHVLFVCEHGNVKSLMAARYFDRLAAERGLAVRGVARGTAPNSRTVPPAIVTGLAADGFDVATFVPQAVSAPDAAAALRVVAIGTELPSDVAGAARVRESWNDVPPASEDFAAARTALCRHLEELVARLAREGKKP